MMTGCEDIRELLSARIDGELSEAESRKLDEHLGSCPACREELVELERVWRALEVLGDVKVPPGLEERTLARVLSAERRPGAPSRRSRWAYPLATAAAIFAILAVGSLLVMNSTAETRQIVRNIDLLENLDVIEHLDALEEMGDGVLVLPPDDKPSATPSGDES
jgi:anti-sigma factor RsiW